MPYPITEENGKYCVNGKCYSDRAKALAYQSALYANVPDAKKKELEELLESDKCWDSYNADDYLEQGYSKLPKSDPRVLYDPMGGASGPRACANCQWFMPGINSCKLVQGDIVATGLSGLWMDMNTEKKVNPIPVTIVDGKEDSPKDAQVVVDPISRGFIDQVKSMIKGIVGKSKENDDVMSGFKVLPDHKWVAYYTNNFEDRQEEVFPEVAHDRYISWVDSKELPMPELWFWHLPVRAGQADWIGRVDHIMMAVGHFDDTPTGQVFEEYYKVHAKEYGTSHGYLYPSFAKQDKAYYMYATFEISPVPKGREANSFTTFEEVKEMSNTLTPEKKSALVNILGKELADKYISNAEQRSKEIEDTGVKFKEVTDPVNAVDSDVREAVKEIGGSLVEAVTGMKSLADGIKALNDSMKAIQDGEKARDQRIQQITEAVKTAFELQPTPRMANTTVIPEDNPLLLELKKKQMEGDPVAKKMGVFDFFGLGAMMGDPKDKPAGS